MQALDNPSEAMLLPLRVHWRLLEKVLLAGAVVVLLEVACCGQVGPEGGVPGAPSAACAPLCCCHPSGGRRCSKAASCCCCVWYWSTMHSYECQAAAAAGAVCNGGGTAPAGCQEVEDGVDGSGCQFCKLTCSPSPGMPPGSRGLPHRGTEAHQEQEQQQAGADHWPSTAGRGAQQTAGSEATLKAASGGPGSSGGSRSVDSSDSSSDDRLASLSCGEASDLISVLKLARWHEEGLINFPRMYSA